MIREKLNSKLALLAIGETRRISRWNNDSSVSLLLQESAKMRATSRPVSAANNAEGSPGDEPREAQTRRSGPTSPLLYWGCGPRRNTSSRNASGVPSQAANRVWSATLSSVSGCTSTSRPSRLSISHGTNPENSSPAKAT